MVKASASGSSSKGSKGAPDQKKQDTKGDAADDKTDEDGLPIVASRRWGLCLVLVSAFVGVVAGGVGWLNQEEPFANVVLRAYLEGTPSPKPHLCGVVTAPRGAVLSELQFLLADSTKEILVAASKEDVVRLVYEGGNATLTQMLPKGTVDRALLALELECPPLPMSKTVPHRFTKHSPRLVAIRDVMTEIEGDDPNQLVPFPDSTVEDMRSRLLGVDLDTRGLWLQETGMLPTAAMLLRSETPLMRLARKCDARGVRALLALGADASVGTDARNKRPLDVAVACNSRQVFATVRELAVVCGEKCLNFDEEGGIPADGLAPIHRVLLRWSSSYFHERPAPNPWNMLLNILLQAGADPLLPTRSKAKETPLHIAAAKRNVQAAELLLRLTKNKQSMLDARDYLGATPLAVAFSWKMWAVTVPRLLASAGSTLTDPEATLRSQALDGVAKACVAELPKYDPKKRGFPSLLSADALARCGFLGGLPLVLLREGARLDALDDIGRTPLYEAHPALLPDSQMEAPALVEIRSLISEFADSALLSESKSSRDHWHTTPTPGSSPSLQRLDEAGDECGIQTITAPPGFRLQDIFAHPNLVSGKMPLLVLGALDSPEWDAARSSWADREMLLKKHGDARVRAGPIPYSSAFAVREEDLTIRQALQRATRESKSASEDADEDRRTAPSYIFEQIQLDDKSPLAELVLPQLGVLANVTSAVFHNAQFYAGDRLSGAPVHYHSHALNALVNGKKRWLLTAPRDAVYSKKPAANIKLSEMKANELPYTTCVQPAGSAIYVPAGWGHAVLNLADNTVGAALEFHFKGELAWSQEDRATDKVSASRRL